MALRGIKVLEFAGLAPGPFCGKILSDHGASVIRVDRPLSPTFAVDVLADNKRSISLDLRKPKAVEIAKKLILSSDVLIDPYRPGVMEKMDLGPMKVTKLNPGIIYARLLSIQNFQTFRYNNQSDVSDSVGLDKKAVGALKLVMISTSWHFLEFCRV